MATHRRSQSASLRRANVYNAFVTRRRYGRRPNHYHWHRKRVDLTVDGLIEAMGRMYAVADSDKIIFW
jgi:hypothetical protein